MSQDVVKGFLLNTVMAEVLCKNLLVKKWNLFKLFTYYSLDHFLFYFTFLEILLRSDKRQAATNFGDRQLLKNLGLWLGAITIARDHPIVTSVFLSSHSIWCFSLWKCIYLLAIVCFDLRIWIWKPFLWKLITKDSKNFCLLYPSLRKFLFLVAKVR